MDEDWRYNDGKMHERQLALVCFSMYGYEINRTVYEFCHYFVSNGMFTGILPTEEDPKEEELKKFGGNVYALAAEVLFREFTYYKEINDVKETPIYQESSEEDYQGYDEAS